MPVPTPDPGPAGTLEPVALDTARSLPARATVRVSRRTLELVVLATPPEIPALRAAPAQARPAVGAPTTPTTGLPLVRSGRPTVLAAPRGALDADLASVTAVAREHGRVVWARPLRAGQVHPITVEGRWLADLHVLALDLPFGAYTGSLPVGDGLRLALDLHAGGRRDLSGPAVPAVPVGPAARRGPFDDLA